MKKVVITIGDPAGCGPYIVLKALHRLRKENVQWIVVGHEKIFFDYPEYTGMRKHVHFISIETPGIERVCLGHPSRESGCASLEYLRSAANIVRLEKGACLVTAPLSKEAVQMVEPSFIGHTEWLATYYHCSHCEMMMVSPRMKVVLFTRHIPTSSVPHSIVASNLVKTIVCVHDALEQQFGIQSPVMAVAAYNPHAGKATFLGTEDKRILKAVKMAGRNVEGPFPADTLFTPESLKKYDCIICLYHDQGMIPFKMSSFRDGVNVTVGLPVIRTSPAHGVAYEVMSSGNKPFCSAMVEAVKLALLLRLKKR